MDKLKKKAELLKMLADDMMCGAKEESMKSLHGMRERDDEDEESEMPSMKATIIAKDEKGLLEGAKKLPEILSKAEAFKKLRLGSKKK